MKKGMDEGLAHSSTHGSLATHSMGTTNMNYTELAQAKRMRTGSFGAEAGIRKCNFNDQQFATVFWRRLGTRGT